MGPDTLSCCPDLLPSTMPENKGVTLLLPFLFVNLIDTSLSHRIQSFSASDPLVLQALQSMNRSIPPAFHSRLSDWQYTEGVLTYKGHVYISSDPSLQWAILACCHDYETAGHPGYLKTCQLVASEFWWLGLASFVHKYIEGCAVCQQSKSNMHPTILSLTPIHSTPTRLFQQVSCDLITDLPLSADFDSLLVMVNHGLTKGVILCPTKKTITAEGIANLFFHKVFLCFSLYNKIISDRGPQFASAFAKELGKLLNYDLSLSTTYHPQSNKETEQVNQEIEMDLWIFCGNNPTSWTNLISLTKFTHNHHPHSVTSQSPFFLMMGYEPHALPSTIQNSAIPAVETRLKNLTAAQNKALAAHELAQQVMATHTQQRFVPFKKGEKVWLEARNLKCSVTNLKFAPKREGPFTITKILSPITYQLHLPKTWKIHPVFYATLLSPYHNNDIHSLNFPAPPSDLITGEKEYEIDWILHHRGSPSRWSFLIRWKGYSAEEDSWVPEWDLKNAKSTLNDYVTRSVQRRLDT